MIGHLDSDLASEKVEISSLLLYSFRIGVYKLQFTIHVRKKILLRKVDFLAANITTSSQFNYWLPPFHIIYV